MYVKDTVLCRKRQCGTMGNPDLVDYESGTPISVPVGFPISLVKGFFVFPIFELDCWMDKMKSHSLRTSKTFNFWIVSWCFRDPSILLPKQSSVGMKKSQKLSSKTLSKTRLVGGSRFWFLTDFENKIFNNGNCHTEWRGIRTTTKFSGVPAGHSEREFCSFVMKVTELMLL